MVSRPSSRPSSRPLSRADVVLEQAAAAQSVRAGVSSRGDVRPPSAASLSGGTVGAGRESSAGSAGSEYSEANGGSGSDSASGSGSGSERDSGSDSDSGMDSNRESSTVPSTARASESVGRQTVSARASESAGRQTVSAATSQQQQGVVHTLASKPGTGLQ